MGNVKNKGTNAPLLIFYVRSARVLEIGNDIMPDSKLLFSVRPSLVREPLVLTAHFLSSRRHVLLREFLVTQVRQIRRAVELLLCEERGLKLFWGKSISVPCGDVHRLSQVDIAIGTSVQSVL